MINSRHKIDISEVLSPLTQSNDISLLESIKVKKIVKAYKAKFNIDVSKYFGDLDEVLILRCNTTSYKFYYPLNLMGDSAFYEHFQNFDWYYSPWKWEHETTLQYLNDGLKVLEVGCAHGAFLRKISESFKLEYSTGLELNETATIKNEKWGIANQTVQEFSHGNKALFDVVCSYQVLEHISDVHSFLEAKIDCLKVNGILIISVPNNDSFIKKNRVGLNSPPHHMGLWNQKSLRALEQIFPIRLQSLHFEELQEYHVGDYVFSEYYAQYPKLLRKLIQKFNQITGTYAKQKRIAYLDRNNIIGHSILAAFIKNKGQ